MASFSAGIRPSTGRLGRHSFVGAGSKLVGLAESRGPRGTRRRLPRLRPREPCWSRRFSPWGWPRSARGRFVVARHACPLRPRARNGRGALRRAGRRHGTAQAVRSLTQPPVHEGGPARRGDCRRVTTMSAASSRPRSTSGSATPSRSSLSQRAERPTSATALELYRSLRRVNPSPYLFLLELDGLALVGSSPETLVKLEGRPRQSEPDRRHDRARRGRRRASALVREGPRRARDARRPRPQRPLARLRAGTVHVERFLEPERFSHVTHLVSEVAGELQRRRLALRPAARLLPRGNRLRARRRCARCRSSPSSKATGAGRTRARSAMRCRTGRSTPASRSARSSCTTATALLQAGAGIVADSDPTAEHEECLRKLAALGAGDRAGGGSAMILLIDNYDSFTYNLAHLFGALGCG